MIPLTNQSKLYAVRYAADGTTLVYGEFVGNKAQANAFVAQSKKGEYYTVFSEPISTYRRNILMLDKSVNGSKIRQTEDDRTVQVNMYHLGMLSGSLSPNLYWYDQKPNQFRLFVEKIVEIPYDSSLNELVFDKAKNRYLMTKLNKSNGFSGDFYSLANNKDEWEKIIAEATKDVYNQKFIPKR